ncbi:alpha/beta hydrolase [Roseivirga sp. E12]|uniref:alpha/beta hydrolase n=1 Tax=Roseivirga sp. E12 TaxID=2819237 RepID=UPI001ABC65C9|nr:alpha/beta fold hydrolase [Roseivirga sp. E12]MBO3699243.1 alpha/beta fold hydrolase [Roseivirga sp. E12]
MRKQLILTIAAFLFVLSCTNSTDYKEEQDLKVELVKHTFDSEGHPIALWEKSNPDATESILLVHGRTWSAVPDFDLQVEGEDLSLMDGLVAEGYSVFAIDLRGYGETPRDDSEWQTPNKGAMDVANALNWIAERRKDKKAPHLFGWSMGSTISHLAAQQKPELMSSLSLFGYWKDSDQIFGPDASDLKPAKTINTAEAAASDFIIPGSISQKAIDAYVTLALKYDPVRVDMKSMDQFNALDPAKVQVPTLILQGEHDPIGPTATQTKLFERLGTAHKQWTVIEGGDHAAFMETPRPQFIHALVNFLKGVSLK